MTKLEKILNVIFNVTEQSIETTNNYLELAYKNKDILEETYKCLKCYLANKNALFGKRESHENLVNKEI